MALSEILKEIREQLGITQEQFAHDLSISFSTLRRWENDHTSPRRLAKIRLIEFGKKNNIDTTTLAELEKL